MDVLKLNAKQTVLGILQIGGGQVSFCLISVFKASTHFFFCSATAFLVQFQSLPLPFMRSWLCESLLSGEVESIMSAETVSIIPRWECGAVLQQLQWLYTPLSQHRSPLEHHPTPPLPTTTVRCESYNRKLSCQ